MPQSKGCTLRMKHHAPPSRRRRLRKSSCFRKGANGRVRGHKIFETVSIRPATRQSTMGTVEPASVGRRGGLLSGESAQSCGRHTQRDATPSPELFMFCYPCLHDTKASRTRPSRIPVRQTSPSRRPVRGSTDTQSRGRTCWNRHCWGDIHDGLSAGYMSGNWHQPSSRPREPGTRLW